VCPRCVFDLARWDRYTAEFGRASPAGSFIVFARAGAMGSYEEFVQNRFGSCALIPTEGWFGLERDETGWWRWAERTGELTVVAGAGARAGTLTAEIGSVPVPNIIGVRIDERLVSDLRHDAPGWHVMPALEVALRSGRTRIRVESSAPPQRAAGDPRLLGVSIKNVRFVLDSGAVCEVVQ
jgi:hypothetical protein